MGIKMEKFLNALARSARVLLFFLLFYFCSTTTAVAFQSGMINYAAITLFKMKINLSTAKWCCFVLLANRFPFFPLEKLLLGRECGICRITSKCKWDK